MSASRIKTLECRTTQSAHPMHLTIKLLKRLLAVIALLLAGIAIGMYVVVHQFNPYQPHAKQNEILTALIKLSDAQIPAVHCEINGTSTAADGQTTNNAVTLADFIARYTSWSLQRNVYDRAPSLVCESDSQICRLNFSGQRWSGYEAWSTHLEFKYDPKSNTVLRDSLSCIDVP